MINQAKILFFTSAAVALAACGESANGREQSAAGVQDSTTSTATETSNIRDEKLHFDAISGSYETDSEHRYITFHYNHQSYSTPHLRWRDWTATLDWDAENPENSSISVVIDVDSIDSGVDRFDDHLRGDQFFDVEKYPEITFNSTSIALTGANAGEITGDLTIKGVTKPVTLDAKINKGAFDERNSVYKLGFSASGAVKRSDFGVDAYVPFVGDDVDLIISAEFVMPADGE